jgi:hypothetical protein
MHAMLVSFCIHSCGSSLCSMLPLLAFPLHHSSRHIGTQNTASKLGMTFPQQAHVLWVSTYSMSCGWTLTCRQLCAQLSNPATGIPCYSTYMTESRMDGGTYCSRFEDGIVVGLPGMWLKAAIKKKTGIPILSTPL